MKKIYISAIICLLFFFTNKLSAQNFTLDDIMSGHEFVGNLPENVLWSDDGTRICFRHNPEKNALSQWYAASVINGKISSVPKKLTPDEVIQFVPEEGNFSRDFTKKIFEKNGDIYLFQKNKSLQQITATNARESNPVFAKNETSVIWQSGDNLFLFDLQTGFTKQLTDFKQGAEKKGKDNEEEAFLKKQQNELFEIIRKREKNEREKKEINEKFRPKRPKEIFTGSFSIAFLQVSPDVKKIAFGLSDFGNPKFTEVHQFVNKNGFAENKKAREKVGFDEEKHSFGMYFPERDTVIYPKFSDLEGIYQNPAYFAEYGRELTAKEPRPVIVNAAYFSPDSKYCVILVRSLDNKDRWVASVNTENGELKTLERQRDEAWIGGPGIDNWRQAVGTAGFMPDGRNFYFQSEKTGFSHLYAVDAETGAQKQLSKGNFEIDNVLLSKTGKYWFFTANKEHPGEYHFYKMPLWGGEPEKITSKIGIHDVQLSPDEKHLAFLFSDTKTPWELYFSENKAGAPYERLTFSADKKFSELNLITPEIITFPAADGANVYARVYRGANPDGRGVIFVHGAGYLQNVHKGWSTYFREFLFHQFLASKGYTVFDIDYRGSKGYGRDWRTGIYRHMGGKDLTDHVDAAKFMAQKYGVSPAKIGIYGGSYGGFITLMAMFQHGEIFKAGAALRAVTDWAHYNHQYTSAILNTPVLDSAAYRRSSPIYFAEGFKANLLICHGLVDDNVQPQDVVRLSQRLIELRKENWEFAVYPIESHGFTESTSWADEYKRIFKLFEENLK